nr:hypothetical protein [Tanacetum cinerariifolium]
MPLINLLSLSAFLTLTYTSVNVSSPKQPIEMQHNAADYVGAWVAHTPKGDFKIVLNERKNVKLPNGQTYNLIVGRHFYLDSRNESLSKPEDKFVLVGIPNISGVDELPMTFTDVVADRTAQVKLSFVG